ncbi:hypothetical protein WL53_21110 [Burkholderia ubonensis]|nr:hypothetical protein WL53_21110 [Burkholderia ubonensis]
MKVQTSAVMKLCFPKAMVNWSIVSHSGWTCALTKRLLRSSTVEIECVFILTVASSRRIE